MLRGGKRQGLFTQAEQPVGAALYCDRGRHRRAVCNRFLADGGDGRRYVQWAGWLPARAT